MTTDTQTTVPRDHWTNQQGVKSLAASLREQSEKVTRLEATNADLLAALEACMEFWDQGSPVHPGALLVGEIRDLLAKVR
jgi:hypothetical protein